MLEKWLIVAVIAGIMSGTAYLKGRQHGSEDYYALVAKLDRTTIIVQKATEKANTTRKDEKARAADVFAGLDLRLSNELPKIPFAPNCALSDADRLRGTEAVIDAANSTLRVPASSKANPEKVLPPSGAGLGKEVGA